MNQPATRSDSLKQMLRRMTENEKAADAFRLLLTEGFYVTDDDGRIHESGPAYDAGLAQTKAWRGEVWKAFRDLEDRLCPVRKFERTGQP